MFLNFLLVFVYIAGIYILFSFTNEKGELTILAIKQSLFGELHNTESLFPDNRDYGHNEFTDISTRNSSFHRELVSLSFFTVV